MKITKNKIIVLSLIVVIGILGFVYYSKIYLPNKTSSEILSKYQKMHLTAKAEGSIFENCRNEERNEIKETISNECDLSYQKIKKSYDSCRLYSSHTFCIEYNDIENAKCTNEIINKNTEKILVNRCLSQKLIDSVDGIKSFFDSIDYDLLNQDDKNIALHTLLLTYNSERKEYLRETINKIIAYNFKYKKEIDFNNAEVEYFKYLNK